MSKSENVSCPHCLGFKEEYDPAKEAAIPCFICSGTGQLSVERAEKYLEDLEIVQNDRERLNEEP